MDTEVLHGARCNPIAGIHADQLRQPLYRQPPRRAGGAAIVNSTCMAVLHELYWPQLHLDLIRGMPFALGRPSAARAMLPCLEVRS
jgi:hypothetical protein